MAEKRPLLARWLVGSFPSSCFGSFPSSCFGSFPSSCLGSFPSSCLGSFPSSCLGTHDRGAPASHAGTTALLNHVPRKRSFRPGLPSWSLGASGIGSQRTAVTATVPGQLPPAGTFSGRAGLLMGLEIRAIDTHGRCQRHMALPINLRPAKTLKLTGISLSASIFAAVFRAEAPH